MIGVKIQVLTSFVQHCIIEFQGPRIVWIMRIYLDYNATAPVHDLVRERLAVFWQPKGYGNPASPHREGQWARARIDQARSRLARAVGCDPDQIVFTGSGTEANALALGEERPCYPCATAHPSILENAGRKAIHIPVQRNGVVDLGALERIVASSPPGIVSVIAANNVTGVLQPLEKIAALVHGQGFLLHVDAVQAFGKISLDFKALDVDFLSLSAHKLGGFAGIGALIVKDRETVTPLYGGGGQEGGLRCGTENCAGILSFAASLDALDEDPNWVRRVSALRDHLESELSSATQNVFFFGSDAPRLGTTSCIAMPGVAAQTQVLALDGQGFAVSAGAACSSGRSRPSHVLLAMGEEHDLAAQAIRVSLGWKTSLEEVDAFINAWITIAKKLGSKKFDGESNAHTVF